MLGATESEFSDHVNFKKIKAKIFRSFEALDQHDTSPYISRHTIRVQEAPTVRMIHF